MKFFRYTHEIDGVERRLTPEQERVWSKDTVSIVGHMLETKRGKTLDELVAGCVKYHYDHFEDCPNDHRDKHGNLVGDCSREPDACDVAKDLLKLLEHNLAVVSYEPPRPSWNNHVLAYAVGHLDVRESPPRFKGVAIYSEFPVTSMGRGDFQIELAREYQQKAGEVFGDGARRLEKRIRDGAPYNYLGWIAPLLPERPDLRGTAVVVEAKIE